MRERFANRTSLANSDDFEIRRQVAPKIHVQLKVFAKRSSPGQNMCAADSLITAMCAPCAASRLLKFRPLRSVMPRRSK